MTGYRAVLASLLMTAALIGVAPVVLAHDPPIATVTPTTPGAAAPAATALPAASTPTDAAAGEMAPMTAPLAPAPAGKSDYEHGLALFRDGNYDAAGSAFSRFIAEHPGHPLSPNARHWLGRSALEAGRYQEAARALKAAYHGEARTAWAPRNLLALAAAYDRLGRRGETCGALRLAARHSHGTAAQRFRATRELDRLSCL